MEVMVVILIIAVLTAIAVPNFLTARNSSATTTCIANLMEIDATKELWAMNTKADTGAVVTVADLVPNYLRANPVCNAGGTYVVGRIGIKPCCSSPEHNLP